MPNTPMIPLSVIGARQHNLKNVSCDIPRFQLVVLTGPSGSGKSSLAFDTIHAEAHRLYLDSLPSAARRHIDHLPRPDVDEVLGLSPSIAIRQNSVSRGGRSTVGTVSELSDYLRILFARAAVAHCPTGGEALQSYTASQIVAELVQLPAGTKLVLLAPRLRNATADAVRSELTQLAKSGFVRVYVDGKPFAIEELVATAVDAARLDLVVDRVVVRDGIASRLSDSVELALKQGSGTLLVDHLDGCPPRAYSESLICTTHSQALPRLDANLFSFNSPVGACPRCSGRGSTQDLCEQRLIPNPKLTLRQGAVAAFGRPGSLASAARLDELVKATRVDPDIAWEALPKRTREMIIGVPQPVQEWPSVGALDQPKRPSKGKYVGLTALLADQLSLDAAQETLDGAPSTTELSSFYRTVVCPSCEGTRLGSHIGHFTFLSETFAQWSAAPLHSLLPKLNGSNLTQQLDPTTLLLVNPLVHAITTRVQFLKDLGLGYISLDTPTAQLSHGEAQRVRLAGHLGSPLVGVLYVVDEPTAGLHPQDTLLVKAALERLVRRGNSLLVVEHNRSIIEAAQWVVDMGPAAGVNGGKIVAQGSVSELKAQPDSVTAPYLDGRKQLERGSPALEASNDCLLVCGATAGNLKHVDVAIPKRRLTAITGVSGAGKSSLLIQTLLPALRAVLRGAPVPEEVCDSLVGAADFARVLPLDQSPLGRSPRSTPATYTGLMTPLRQLYASLPESRARGYGSSRFSFNVKGGRCEVCKGEGIQRAELQLLADVVIACPECGGSRYNRETLIPKFRGLSIADALSLTVSEALNLFSSIPRLTRTLSELARIGLAYLSLDQPATSLSGGEAQRVRLAGELSRAGEGSSLYLLDEPTAGLHFQDLQVVVDALFLLRDQGHTVVIVEHNMTVVALADWVIDLGPGAAESGGTVVSEGPPQCVAQATTPTGAALRQALS